MATRIFCDRCSREICYGTTGKWREAWGAYVGLDHVERHQISAAGFKRELCGDCATEVEAFITQPPAKGGRS